MKTRKSFAPLISAFVALVAVFPCWMALAAQTFGPYSIQRTFTLPQFSLGDLEYANGFIYSTDHTSPTIHRLNPLTGQELQTWTPAGAGLRLTGLAWDGANIWAAQRDDKRVSKLNLPASGQGSVLTSFNLPSPAGSGLYNWAMDLTYANGYFYYPEYMGPIHKMDAKTGIEVGIIPAPSGTIYALTFDGQNLLAAEGAGPDDTLWRISPQDGTILDTWHTGITAGTVGLAYDLSSHTLYIGDWSRVTVAVLVPEPASVILLPVVFLVCLLLRCRTWSSSLGLGAGCNSLGGAGQGQLT